MSCRGLGYGSAHVGGCHGGNLPEVLKCRGVVALDILGSVREVMLLGSLDSGVEGSGMSISQCKLEGIKDVPIGEFHVEKNSTNADKCWD